MYKVFKSDNFLLSCRRTAVINNLYNKLRHSYIYMLPIAGQTAGLIGLKFFVDTHGWLGGVLGKKSKTFF